jgi:hypothetical protein
MPAASNGVGDWRRDVLLRQDSLTTDLTEHQFSMLHYQLRAKREDGARRCSVIAVAWLGADLRRDVALKEPLGDNAASN